MPSPISPSITIVTVTYGNRWELVRQVLQYAADTASIAHIVLVNNGSDYGLAANIERDFSSPKVVLVDSTENRGSAWGFNAGIAAALDLSGQYILLLDDDNVPEQGCDINLLGAVGRHSGLNAVAAYRPTIGRQALALQGIEKIVLRKNSYAGFDVSEFIPRLVRKFRQLSGRHYEFGRECCIAYAPYGGFFASTDVIRRMGLPNVDYFVYGDDNEFTYRLTKIGGAIWLQANCVVKDVDQSWGTQEHVHPYFIMEAPEFRLRRTVENIARFETEQGFGGGRYVLNRSIFLGLHAVRAMLHYKSIGSVLTRYNTLLQYAEAGKAKALTASRQGG